jgi:hypothetical protein
MYDITDPLSFNRVGNAPRISATTRRALLPSLIIGFSFTSLIEETVFPWQEIARLSD